MRWVWTKQRADGTFDEVGMNNRGMIRGNRNKAARCAIDLVYQNNLRPVRMQGWHEWNFYKNDAAETEFITVYGG